MNCWLIYCSMVRWRVNPSGAMARSTTRFLGQVKTAPSARVGSTYGRFYFIFKPEEGWRILLVAPCPGVEVSRLHPTSQEPGRVFSASQASCNELISKRDFQGKLTADDYGKMFSKGETIYDN